MFSRPSSGLASLAALGLLTSATLSAQIQRPGKLNETYAQLCASCHGAQMEGGQAPSMLDDVWSLGGDDESLARSIRAGSPAKGMPAWGSALSEQEIRSMVIFIREQRAKAQATPIAKPAESITVTSQLHAYQLNTWVEGLEDPWSLNFLPDGRAIVTEKSGRLTLIENGKLAAAPINGVPAVDSRGQAGLYDVVPHPDYTNNGWLYLAFSDPKTNAEGKPVSLTRIIRGRLRDGALVDQQTIFEAPVAVYPNAGGVHFGGRMAFDRAGYLFFTIGERGTKDNAQNLAVPMGKVHRLHDDGGVPADNPFVNQAGAVPSIWSYGHRNPQGLAFHPATGALYDAEHGPRGGDELNVVRKGLNYGWPVITFGMEYDGSPITAITAKEGMEQPLNYWVPSIAPAGISFYTGDLFPKWKHHLFIATLGTQQLNRLEIQGDKVVGEEVLFKGLGRVRHVASGPDGALYVLLPNRIARITPAP
ncbi:MAG TPA: PQQ-dependent sugar dehydrogenase [Opitutaceae bacterium]